MSKKIKVLIVDDSAFMRKSLSLLLADDEDIEVIGTARNGLEGFNLAREKKPDLITLDIEMPVMDGITALEKIMKECPTPVLMVSSLTTEGAESTIKAMELGAVDFIPKGMSYVNIGIVNIKEDLIKKIKSIVRQRIMQDRMNRIRKPASAASHSTSTAASHLNTKGFKAIALGISTGGPLSLQKVIPQLNPSMHIPMFIVQHMPPKFTKSLAERLNSLSQVTVKEAEDGEIVKNGFVYIAQGGKHMTIEKDSSNVKIKISDLPADTLYKPCVDVMINSVINVYGSKTLGVIMTGMGKDGLLAIQRLKSIGGSSLAQDELSCVVYGMPKAIVDHGAADAVLPLDKIAGELNRIF